MEPGSELGLVLINARCGLLAFPAAQPGFAAWHSAHDSTLPDGVGGREQLWGEVACKVAAVYHLLQSLLLPQSAKAVQALSDQLARFERIREEDFVENLPAILAQLHRNSEKASGLRDLHSSMGGTVGSLLKTDLARLQRELQAEHKEERRALWQGRATLALNVAGVAASVVSGVAMLGSAATAGAAAWSSYQTSQAAKQAASAAWLGFRAAAHTKVSTAAAKAAGMAAASAASCGAGAAYACGSELPKAFQRAKEGVEALDPICTRLQALADEAAKLQRVEQQVFKLVEAVSGLQGVFDGLITSLSAAGDQRRDARRVYRVLKQHTMHMKALISACQRFLQYIQYNKMPAIELSPRTADVVREWKQANADALRRCLGTGTLCVAVK